MVTMRSSPSRRASASYESPATAALRNSMSSAVMRRSAAVAAIADIASRAVSAPWTIGRPKYVWRANASSR